MRALKVAALCVAAFFIAVGSATAQEGPPWWNRAWRYRKLVTVPTKGTRSFQFWLHAGDRALPDGHDVRVISPDGKPMPASVVYSTPHGAHLVTFDDTTPPPELPKGEDGKPVKGAKLPREKPGFFAVYYGNRQAPGGRLPELKRGLVLETRAFPEDTKVDSWKAASETLARADTVYGVSYWGRVFDAYNPFGPQKNYISVYHGYFNVKTGGAHKFAALSEDASFLLIDDRLVCQLPGRNHGLNTRAYGRRDKKYGAAVTLGAGRHKIKFVTFSFGGPKRALVMWFPAGGKMRTVNEDPSDPESPTYEIEAWSVLPGGVFQPVARPNVRQTQSGTSMACADFGAQPLNYLEAGGAKMVTMKFSSLSTVNRGLIRSWKWDFGDGQTHTTTKTETDIVHLYLVPEPHEVSLTITSTAGGSDTFKMTVDVKPIESDLDFQRPKKDKFWKLTENMVVEKLPTSHLFAFVQFAKDRQSFEFYEDPKIRARIFDVCSALDKRRDDLKNDELYDVAIALGRYYLDPLNQWKTAEQYFKLALEQCKENDSERLFNARFHLADMYFYYADDLYKARKGFETLREDFPATDPVRRRVAFIRLGDIKRSEGKIEDARQIYEEAEMDPAYRPKEPRAVVEGRYMHEVETFLKARPDELEKGEDKGKRALKALDEWTWTFPTKRLDGRPMVLRLQANMMINNYEEVRKQGEIYLSFAKDPDFVPQVHVLVGEACYELGRKDDARTHWGAVLKDWKESPYLKDAENGLYRLNQED